jgi:hypothetical protein
VPSACSHFPDALSFTATWTATTATSSEAVPASVTVPFGTVWFARGDVIVPVGAVVSGGGGATTRKVTKGRSASALPTRSTACTVTP